SCAGRLGDPALDAVGHPRFSASELHRTPQSRCPLARARCPDLWTPQVLQERRWLDPPAKVGAWRMSLALGLRPPRADYRPNGWPITHRCRPRALPGVRTVKSVGPALPARGAVATAADGIVLFVIGPDEHQNRETRWRRDCGR